VRATLLERSTTDPSRLSFRTVPRGASEEVAVTISTEELRPHKDESASPRKPKEPTESKSANVESFEV
jgi:hypothetical protein